MMVLTGWGKEIIRWYHQDRALMKSTNQPSISPVWTKLRIQRKQVLKVLDYAPSKNENPRADAIRANRQVNSKLGEFTRLDSSE